MVFFAMNGQVARAKAVASDPFIERMSSSQLRWLAAAAHVERWAAQRSPLLSPPRREELTHFLAMNKSLRAVLAVATGLCVWFAAATLGNFVLRALLPEYTAVERAMNFTLTMLVARLFLGAVSSLAAGAACAAVSRSSKASGYMLAALLLALFVPVHVDLWEKFPLWYHAIFLGSLVPLSILGTKLINRRRQGAA